MLAKKPKGATQRRGSSGAAGLVWMIVGALLTLMIGFFIYLWNPFDMGVKSANVEREGVQPINNAEGANDDYEFYDLLPDQEITNIPEATIIEDAQNSTTEQLEPDVVVLVPRPQADDNDEVDASNNASSPVNEGSNTNSGASNTTVVNANSNNSNNSNSNNSSSNNANANGQNSHTNSAPNRQASNTPSASTANSTQSQTSQPTDKVAIVEETSTYDAATGSVESSASASSTKSANADSAVSAGVEKTYILQINSYSTSEEADKRRAQVLMAGVDAQVIRRKMDNGQVFYQVVSAQMSNQNRVQAAQKKLQNNGIDSLIVEQRRP